MATKKSWNVLKLIAKIAFTMGALYWAYTKIDFATLTRIFRQAKFWFFIPALASFMVSQLISSYRLLQFFRNIELPIGFLANLRLYLLGMFYNLFLPGGIGGDGYKILKLKMQYGTSHKAIFMAVFFDRLSGLWGLGFLLVFLGMCLPELVTYRWGLSLFFAGTLIYYFVVRYFFSSMLKRFITSHALAICVQLFQLIAVMFLLMTLGCPTDYLPYLVIFLISSLASLFPFSLGGLGAREVVLIWAAATFNLNKDIAVSVGLCFYMITAITALTAIFVLFRKEYGTETPKEKELCNIS